MDGRTFLSLISTTITLGLFFYALYCAILAYVVERGDRRGADAVPNPTSDNPNCRVVARLAFGAAALLGILALSATAASWAPLKGYLGPVHGRPQAGSFAGGVRAMAVPARPEAPSTPVAFGIAPDAPATTLTRVPPAPALRREPSRPAERKSAAPDPAPARVVAAVPPPSDVRVNTPAPTETAKTSPRSGARPVIDVRAAREGQARPDVRSRLAGGARPQRLEHLQRIDLDPPTPIERIERPQRPERSERVERVARVERPERIDRPQRPDRVERPERQGGRR